MSVYFHFWHIQYLCAVVIMASTTSMILCSAESVPMVISVPQKSLSIEPTIPTICNAEWVWAASSLIWPGRNTAKYYTIQYSYNLQILVPCISPSHSATRLDKLIQESTPLLPEEISPGQTAISTNHTQVSDATLHQVQSSTQTTLVGTKILTAGAANHSATLHTHSSIKKIQFICNNWCFFILIKIWKYK